MPFYFISGVSGAGKTAVMPYLKSLLTNTYEVHDFDERGVPDNAGHEWRLEETRNWLHLGQEQSKQGIVLVVCGFANPDELSEMQKDFSDLQIETILLDGDATLIEKRLRDRNTKSDVKADLARAVGSVDAFIENNTRFVPILREICKRHNCQIVDTSHLDPESIAKKVVTYVTS